MVSSKIILLTFLLFLSSCHFMIYPGKVDIVSSKLKDFEYLSGSGNGKNEFYIKGGILGDMPLEIDFESIKIIHFGNHIRIKGAVRDLSTGEPLYGCEIVFARIVKENEFTICYEPRVSHKINGRQFEIESSYDDNEIILVNYFGYFVTYYKLKAIDNYVRKR
jgi:hypothetical protein